MKYLTVLFFCLLSSFAFSQQLDEIFVHPVNIYVYDEKENPLSGVEVGISDGKEMVGTHKTDEKGHVAFEGLMTAEYDIFITTEGGRKVVFENQLLETEKANDRIFRLNKDKHNTKKK
jgi:hypothetical protein